MLKLNRTFIIKLILSTTLPLSAFAADNFSVKILNGTGNTKSKQIFLLVKGSDPSNNNKPCFMQFTPSNPNSIGHCIEINKNSQSADYSYPLSDFQQGTIHLPNIASGRIYLSINQKLTLPIVGSDDHLGIADPNVYNNSDPNYNILFDKVELTYLGHTTVINPTAVDFISLPIAITQNDKTYGITASRQDIIATLSKTFNDAPESSWQSLTTHKNLRVLAAGRDGASFNPNYLNNPNGYNYINDLWSYYKSHTISVDCSELNLKYSKFTGQVNAQNQFVFTNQDKSQTVTFTAPTSNQFFLAAQGTFSADNNTPRAIIVRDLTAAWSVGLLPASDKTLLNKDFFSNNKKSFYTINPYLSSQGQHNGPWYNLYAKAIHAISQNDYAWPYDDVLGLDGTNTSTDDHVATLTIGKLN